MSIVEAWRSKADASECVFGEGVDLGPSSAIPWSVINHMEVESCWRYLHSSSQAVAGVSFGPA